MDDWFYMMRYGTWKGRYVKDCCGRFDKIKDRKRMEPMFSEFMKQEEFIFFQTNYLNFGEASLQKAKRYTFMCDNCEELYTKIELTGEQLGYIWNNRMTRTGRLENEN